MLAGVPTTAEGPPFIELAHPGVGKRRFPPAKRQCARTDVLLSGAGTWRSPPAAVPNYQLPSFPDLREEAHRGAPKRAGVHRAMAHIRLTVCFADPAGVQAHRGNTGPSPMFDKPALRHGARLWNLEWPLRSPHNQQWVSLASRLVRWINSKPSGVPRCPITPAKPLPAVCSSTNALSIAFRAGLGKR